MIDTPFAQAVQAVAFAGAFVGIVTGLVALLVPVRSPEEFRSLRVPVALAAATTALALGGVGTMARAGWLDGPLGITGAVALVFLATRPWRALNRRLRERVSERRE